MLLGGEPGIGKTRLAAAAALDAHAAGFDVGWGAASDGLRAPYGTWITALSRLVEHAPEDVLAPVLRRHGRQLGRLLPGLAPAPSDPPAVFTSDPETERYLLFARGRRPPRGAVGASGRWCIVLDDLHWSDTPSLDPAPTRRRGHRPPAAPAARHLPRHRGPARRPAGHRASPTCCASTASSALILDGLTVDDIDTLMTEVAGHDIGPAGRDLAAEIWEETGGNAFFAGQILRHLTEAGVIGQDADGRWEVRASLAEHGLPGTVRDVVVGRVARLGEEAEAALTLAAVIGRAFDLALLERLSDDDVLPALEAALGAAVVTEPAPGRFAFAHAIINHTLAAQLSAARRSRLHCRVAQAVAELPGDHVAEVAHHWLAAGAPAHADDAIDAARRAGDRALEQLAPDEAMHWYARGLRAGARPTIRSARRSAVTC